jgi:hypothetical protein
MFLFDLVQYQHRAAHFSFRVLKAQIRYNSIHFFSQQSLIEGSNGQCNINSIVLSFFGSRVEAVVEIDESFARVWPFGTRWKRLWAWAAWLV